MSGLSGPEAMPAPTGAAEPAAGPPVVRVAAAIWLGGAAAISVSSASEIPSPRLLPRSANIDRAADSNQLGISTSPPPKRGNAARARPVEEDVVEVSADAVASEPTWT